MNFKRLLPLMLAGAALAACNSEKTAEKEEAAEAKAPTFTKLWETDTVLTTCESVLFVEDSNFMYVSNINGMPTDKNGAGFISKVNTDGSIKELKWATGLNAPKGMGIAGNLLYVTDIDKIAAIDLASGQIVKTYSPDTAVFLNDISVYDNVVYISDMKLGRILKIENDSLSVVRSDMENINGLYADQDGLHLLYAAGMACIKDGEVTVVNDSVTGGDGLERLSDSVFVASRWKGDVFLIRGTSADLLLDTQAESSNTADIGLDRKNKIVFVPTFFKNKVVAYQLAY